jgi:hypothetical protein
MILREDDKEERIVIQPDLEVAYKEVPDPQNPMKKLKMWNPMLGNYSCTVTIGPSYATKRIEASENMMAFAKAMPQTAMMIADLIAKAQDWPEAEQMAARLAKAVPPNLLTPDQRDVPPQIQAIIQNLENQIKQLGQQLQAATAALNDKDKDRQVAMAKIQNDFEAKLLAIVQKADEAVQKHIGSHVQNLASDVRDLATQITATKKPDDPDGGGNQSGNQAAP